MSTEFIIEHHPKPTNPTAGEALEDQLELQKTEFLESYCKLLPQCGFEKKSIAIHSASTHYEYFLLPSPMYLARRKEPHFLPLIYQNTGGVERLRRAMASAPPKNTRARARPVHG